MTINPNCKIIFICKFHANGINTFYYDGSSNRERCAIPLNHPSPNHIADTASLSQKEKLPQRQHSIFNSCPRYLKKKQLQPPLWSIIDPTY
jgi:hypothetical protein